MNNNPLLCDIDKFLGYYGPRKSIDEKYILDCRQYLVKSGVLKISDQQTFYWRDLNHGPVAAVAKEGTDANAKGSAFANIIHIIEAIDAFAGNKKGHPYVYRMVPSKDITFEIAKAAPRIDATLVHAGWVTPGDLPLCFVHNQNVRLQTAAYCRWVMSEDPRRTHVYAISVEGDRMSVWYFSPSHSMKALAFDWIGKDIDKCIHVFLAFALATPKELGIDDSITLAPLDSTAPVGSAVANQHYIYRCPVLPISTDATDAAQPAASITEFKYFKTVQIIKAMRPYNLDRRNTRIWKVVEVTGPESNEIVTGDELVLKDVWLEETQKTEAENLKLVFEDLEKLIDKAGATTGRKPCEPSLDVCEAAMHSPRGESIFHDDDIVTESHIQSAARTQANPGLHSLDNGAKNRKEQPRHFAPRAPSRFIYKEVCSDLDTVGTLGNVMDVLNQALKALRILFCAGWVHRDISSGNILAMKENGKWKVKLADFEFSQRLAHVPAHGDHRIGTPYFMPLEIMEESYLLEELGAGEDVDPRQTMAHQLGLKAGTPAFDIMKRFYRFGYHDSLPSDANLDAIPGPETDLRYNFQHDLESLWWIVIYFISARVEHKASQLAAQAIFPHKIEASGKRFFTFSRTVNKQSFLGHRLHAHLQTLFLTFIENLRSNLHTEYLDRELLGRLLVPHTYSAIHAIFARAFARLLADDTANWKEMPVLTAADIMIMEAEVSVAAGSKRGRDEDEDIGNDDNDGDDEANPASTSKKAKHRG